MNNKEKRALVEKLEEEKRIYTRIVARGNFEWILYGNGFEDQEGENSTLDEAYATMYDKLVEIGVLE